MGGQYRVARIRNSKTESLTKTQSAVEFKAIFQGDECEQAHQERSIFVKIEDRWYFVDPTVSLPTMKQPCVCDSGKNLNIAVGIFYDFIETI